MTTTTNSVPKAALITGGSRGIGAACARLFAQQGYGVGIVCRKAKDQAEALAEELAALGVPVKVYVCDVAQREQVQAMTAAFLREFGRIDVLVCNAGIARQELFTDITEASWREVMGVDLDGVFTAPKPSCRICSTEKREKLSRSPRCGGRWGPPARSLTPRPRPGSSA